MTGRAKWDAWTAAGKQYQDAQEAEKRYLEIAQTLGWTENGTTSSQVQRSIPSSSTDEGLWDDDNDNDTPETSKSGGGGGMGLSVSVMMPSPSVIDKSIHGLALSNDVSGLTTLLEQCPETDLDALDEFVSLYIYLFPLDVNLIKLGQGYTPLHLACDRGNIAIVRLLLKKGADHDLKVIIFSSKRI